MTAPDDGLARLIAEFETQREQLTRMQDELTSASATATSPRNEVTVTVGSTGLVEGLRFNNRDYRKLGPEDLAELILATIDEARSEVQERVTATMTAFTTDGDVVADMMSGAFDWQSIFPADLGQRLAEGTRRPDEQ